MCNPQLKTTSMEGIPKKHIFTSKKLASKLARSKAKLELLSCDVDINLFSSLRLHVGKLFKERNLEERKGELLRTCQKELFALSRLEAESNLKCDRENLRRFFEREDVQALDFESYKILTNICHSHESALISRISKDHERKIRFFDQRLVAASSSVIRSNVKPEKKFKHRSKMKMWRREKQKKKRERVALQKKEKLQIKLDRIKSSNLVQNFSSEEIPDEVYFYLALGSGFVPTKIHDKHDFIFDTKLFCRKLAWSLFYHEQYAAEANDVNDPQAASSNSSNYQNTSSNSEIVGWGTPTRLKIKGKSFPELNNKLFDKVMKKILSDIDGIGLSEKRWDNLTYLERKGLLWCRKAIRERRLYITKADKGGAMLILDAELVNDIILSKLNDEKNFVKLTSDPRSRIKSDIKHLTLKFEEKGLISRNDCFLISGQTEKGGMSHNPSFCVGKPYVYPLFKIHKLSEQQISDKVIPPIRLVTSGVAGPTYRLGIFLDNLLQPVIKKYCAGEIVKDTTTFLSSLASIEESGAIRGCKLMGTLDVEALYPSIKISFVQEAIRHALISCTQYSTDHINMIVELVNFSINNAVIHYRGGWYSHKEGIPTGGSDSGSIANIYVKWCLDQKILANPDVVKYNRIDQRKRFLDDIWFLWRGSERSFSMFLNSVNKIGSQFGITLKGDVDVMINFLDVTVLLVGECIKTTLFVKPTDAQRYLHRKSDHSWHTFRSIPYSQFRRTVVVCSDPSDRDHFINHMMSKFTESGYSEKELVASKERALLIDRAEVLRKSAIDNSDVPQRDSDSLTFVINHDKRGSAQIRKIIKENQEIINHLFGKEIKVVVAERRNPNTASILFAKSAFAQKMCEDKESQKCHSPFGCLTCPIINMPKTVCVNGLTVNLDFSLNCKTENVIYLFICKLCPNNKEFYFGQSINSVQDRSNGHRSNFDEGTFKKSALAFHIWDAHRDKFGDKLNNFTVGVVRSTLPQMLDRAEDFFITKTDADVVGMNRYKVLA